MRKTTAVLAISALLGTFSVGAIKAKNATNGTFGKRHDIRRPATIKPQMRPMKVDPAGLASQVTSYAPCMACTTK